MGPIWGPPYGVSMGHTWGPMFCQHARTSSKARGRALAAWSELKAARPARLRAATRSRSGQNPHPCGSPCSGLVVRPSGWGTLLLRGPYLAARALGELGEPAEVSPTSPAFNKVGRFPPILAECCQIRARFGRMVTAASILEIKQTMCRLVAIDPALANLELFQRPAGVGYQAQGFRHSVLSLAPTQTLAVGTRYCNQHLPPPTAPTAVTSVAVATASPRAAAPGQCLSLGPRGHAARCCRTCSASDVCHRRIWRQEASEVSSQ